MKVFLSAVILSLTMTSWSFGQTSQPPEFSPALLVAEVGDGVHNSVCVQGLPGAAMTLETCEEPSPTSQVFAFIAQGTAFQLQFASSDDCVGLNGNSVVRASCSSSASSQLWTLSVVGNSRNVSLTNRQSGLCISVASQTPGSQLTQANCNRSTLQTFQTFRPVSEIPEGQGLAAGTIFQVPPGEITFISVIGGGVVPVLDHRTVYIYASDDKSSLGNCDSDVIGVDEPVVAVSGGTDQRTSIFFAASAGQFYCWNVIPLNPVGNAFARSWTVNVEGL